MRAHIASVIDSIAILVVLARGTECSAITNKLEVDPPAGGQPDYKRRSDKPQSIGMLRGLLPDSRVRLRRFDF
jgi:hypothetical protein